jgi:hypothetical protein
VDTIPHAKEFMKLSRLARAVLTATTTTDRKKKGKTAKAEVAPA